MVHYDMQKWEPNPDKPGYLRNAGNRTFGEVGQAIEGHLRSQQLASWEWFQVGDVIIEQSEMPIPAYQSLMVGFHGGRNEGEIVKLIGITKEQTFIPIIFK